MRPPYTQLYLHCVWSTWDRLPLLEPDVERVVYAAITGKCQALRCEPIAIGGMPDHVHVLLRLATTISIADLLKEVKGSASHLLTHRPGRNQFFKWQGGYGAFTLAKDDVSVVKSYVLRQKEHHADNSLLTEWEPGALGEGEGPGG